MTIKQLVLSLVAISVISACGGGGGSASTSVVAPTPTPTPTPTPPASDSTELVKYNQLGFLSTSAKYFVSPETSGSGFEVINKANNEVVFTGTLSEQTSWAPSNTIASLGDFSIVQTAGDYTIKVEGLENTVDVRIGDDVFLAAHDAALKAYYFNRASMALAPQYAGEWERALGHPDTQVLVHASAADDTRPTGTVISSSKGWYDAGDYNKYIVNSGISTYTLLAAYQQSPDFYAQRDINIPESGNDVPDLLDEIKWNLDWMLSMQDPNDGGVYHKLTTLNFSGTQMPAQSTDARYVVQKGTAAALNLSAVMAKASRVYDTIPALQAQAAVYADAAVLAWEWAQANPNVQYNQPSDVTTGEYGDNKFDDERLWAAAELYLLTQEAQYLTMFNDLRVNQNVNINVPNWFETAALGYMSMLTEGKQLLSGDNFDALQGAAIALADDIVEQTNSSAYGVAMVQSDFNWGSNSSALNKSVLALIAFDLTSEVKYKDAAIGLVDYVLGRNPTDYSFITGYGVQTPLDIHHRVSFADSVPAPVPGFVAGGPHSGQQDGCSYPSNQSALSYLDDWCSYSTNEVTINWNAPLVYTLGVLSQ